MKLKLSVFIIAAVLLAACSKIDNTETDEKIWSITGYYMRASYGDFIIFERCFTSQNGNAEIYYEPVEFYFGEGEEGDVPVDSLKTGDKIEVDVKEITAAYPGFARIYGLRLIESGDVSNINDSALLELEECGIHAVIGEKSEQPSVMRYSGYFVRTKTDCFLVPAEKYGTLSDVDILKIYPASEAEASPGFDMSGVSLDGFNTGDVIWVDIMLVQEMYPPLSPVCGTALIEAGGISDMDPNVISKLEELGYSVTE